MVTVELLSPTSGTSSGSRLWFLSEIQKSVKLGAPENRC
jgi:hypothetical protein